jgi:hypothetical protein
LFWGNDSGTIRAHETGFALSSKNGCNASHIMLRNSLCDSNDKRNFGSNGLQSIRNNGGKTSRIASAANAGGTKIAVASAIISH